MGKKSLRFLGANPAPRIFWIRYWENFVPGGSHRTRIFHSLLPYSVNAEKLEENRTRNLVSNTGRLC